MILTRVTNEKARAECTFLSVSRAPDRLGTAHIDLPRVEGERASRCYQKATSSNATTIDLNSAEAVSSGFREVQYFFRARTIKAVRSWLAVGTLAIDLPLGSIRRAIIGSTDCA